MTNADLLIEVKKGLSIPEATTGFDGVLSSKVKAVKSYMSAAGVSDDMLDDDLSVEAIVLGVNDMWNLGGEVKFSPLFVSIVTQLAASSLPPAEE